MNEPTTALIRKLAEAATDGTWICFIDKNGICDVLPACRPGTVAASLTRPDAMYIAAINPKVIIDLLDRLKTTETSEAATQKLYKTWHDRALLAETKLKTGVHLLSQWVTVADELAEKLKAAEDKLIDVAERLKAILKEQS